MKLAVGTEARQIQPALIKLTFFFQTRLKLRIIYNCNDNVEARPDPDYD